MATATARPTAASPDRRRRHTHGFTVVEMLLSASLTLVAIAAMFSTLEAYRRLHFDQTERVEVEQDLRAVWDFMVRDIESAGYHLINRGKLGNFGTLFPNADASDSFNGHILTAWSNPGVAEASLTTTLAATNSHLLVDNPTGFAVGMKVWVMGFCNDDTIQRSLVTLSQVATAAPWELRYSSPTSLPCRFRNGAKVVRLRHITWSLSAPVGGVSDILRKVDEAAPTVIASGMTALDFTWLDNGNPAATLTPNDAPRRRAVRRVRVRLAGRTLATMRGSGLRPNVEFTGEVAPRNLVLQEIL